MPAGRMYVSARRSKQRSLNFKQVKQVQKIIQKNKQLKNVRKEIASNGITTTGILQEITAISEGDNFNNRDGDKVQVLSMKLHSNIYSGAAGTNNTQIRCMLVRGKYGPLALADMPADEREQPDLDKMQVYFDRLYTLGAAGSGDDHINGVLHYKSFKNSKVPHLLVHFDDDESATAAQSNPLYIFAISNTAANGPSWEGWVDTKFFNAN